MKKGYSRIATQTGDILPYLITITSLTAAGKTSLVDELKKYFSSENIKMEYVSVGRIMRDFAKELGFSSIEDFSKHNLLNPKDGYDLKCDNKVRKIGEQNFQIIEGRLPHFFVPRGFHIFLRCPLEIRAERRHKNQNPDNLSLESITRNITQRDDDDQSRYKILYQGCIWPEEKFDLVIDSSRMTLEEEVGAIILGREKWASDNEKIIKKP